MSTVNAAQIFHWTNFCKSVLRHVNYMKNLLSNSKTFKSYVCIYNEVLHIVIFHFISFYIHHFLSPHLLACGSARVVLMKDCFTGCQKSLTGCIYFGGRLRRGGDVDRQWLWDRTYCVCTNTALPVWEGVPSDRAQQPRHSTATGFLLHTPCSPPTPSAPPALFIASFLTTQEIWIVGNVCLNRRPPPK